MQNIKLDLENMLENLRQQHKNSIVKLSQLLNQINYYEKDVLDCRNKIQDLEKLLNKQEE